MSSNSYKNLYIQVKYYCDPWTDKYKCFPAECANCGRTGRRSKILKCAGCRKRRYCNSMCQAQHWPEHKKFCKKNPYDAFENFLVSRGYIARK